MLPLERRTGVTEVEIGYDAPAAMAEAQRCLHCWVNTIFEGMPEDGSMCILCGGCVDVCPEKCLELVSLDRIAFEPETVQHIRDNQELFGVEFDEVDGRRTRSCDRSRNAERRDPVYPLRAVRDALPRGHDHDGVVQPDSR